MYSFRVSQYITTTPPKPELDLRGTNFLTLGRVWDSPSWATMQAPIRQEMINLIGVVAQHAAARDENDRRPFVDVLKNAGSALLQIGNRPDVNDAGIKAAAGKLQAVTNSMPAEEFTNRATEAQQAMATKFPGVKPYPQINPEATAAPTEPEIPDTTGDDLVKKNTGADTQPAGEPSSSTPTPTTGKPAGPAAAPRPTATPHPTTPHPAAAPKAPAPAPKAPAPAKK
jgi:hypothetical protein